MLKSLFPSSTDRAAASAVEFTLPKMIMLKRKIRKQFTYIGVKLRYYKETLEEAGIEEADFHTLRHTFATRCIESGTDILMVASSQRFNDS